MADPELLSQLGQGEILSCAKFADLLADHLVNARWGTGTGNSGFFDHFSTFWLIFLCPSAETGRQANRYAKISYTEGAVMSRKLQKVDIK
jgi:hypothetical protein